VTLRGAPPAGGSGSRHLVHTLAPALVATFGAATAVTPMQAQLLGPGPHGFYLNVAGSSAHSAFGAGGVSDFQRLRLMAAPALGPLRFEAAYEQTLLYLERMSGTIGVLAPRGAGTSANWIDLEWPVDAGLGAHFTWRHRFDRLDVALPAGRFEARIGRQALSWATTLLLTPADPFAPFDPSDPFREYRGGVDAARLQYFPGPFSTVDVVVRPSRTPLGRTLTALARAKITVASWDLSAWGGVLHDEAAGAVGATRTVAGAAVRAEVSLRRGTGGAAVVRAAVGADRRWTVLGRDLYAVLEVQHDGFGAGRPADLAATALSAPYRRGEMQVLGRDVAAAQATYQLHPLVRAELLLLGDLRDGSLLLAPAAAVSVSDNVGLRAGLYLAAGRSPDALGVPRSEFGTVPRAGYLSLSAYF
jgi:hypothetical protein